MRFKPLDGGARFVPKEGAATVLCSIICLWLRFEGLPDFDTVPKLGGGVFGTGSKVEDLKFYRSVHLEPVRGSDPEHVMQLLPFVLLPALSV